MMHLDGSSFSSINPGPLSYTQSMDINSIILSLVLIDKDNEPNWKPSTLLEVTSDKVDSYFLSLGENELEF